MTFLYFFQPISNADFIVPVEIEGTVHQVSHSLLFCCKIHALIYQMLLILKFEIQCTYSVFLVCLCTGICFSWFVIQVYVLKRPFVDEFLRKMGEMFECVLFTASLAKVSLCVHIYLALCSVCTKLDVIKLFIKNFSWSTNLFWWNKNLRFKKVVD